jgi:ABC-type uncharacterized transport system auxiliary subunit
VKSLPPAIFAAFLAACAVLSPPLPQPAAEVLSRLPDGLPHHRPQSANLIVLPTESDTDYGSTRIAYSEAPYRLRYYRDHEWAAPPATMINKLLIETMQRTGFFPEVLTPPDSSRGAYTLRTTLTELLQDYTRSPPVAQIAVRAELLGQSSQPIASRDFKAEKTMNAKSPDAGVVAAIAAASKLLADVAEFVIASTR